MWRVLDGLTNEPLNEPRDGLRTYIYLRIIRTVAYFAKNIFKDDFGVIIFHFSKQCWYSQRKHQTLMNIKWNRCTHGFFIKHSSFHFDLIILSLFFHFDFITPDLSLFFPTAPGKCFSDLSQWYVFRMAFPHYNFAFPFYPFTLCRMFFEI